MYGNLRVHPAVGDIVTCKKMYPDGVLVVADGWHCVVPLNHLEFLDDDQPEADRGA